jgi:hypothetical protein
VNKVVYGIKPLSLKDQIQGMAKYPQLKSRLKKGIAIWQGPWSPSESGNEYEVHITYKFLCRPLVAILSPELELAEGKKKLPHVFRGGQGDLCLHVKSDWNPSLLISDTIMPWLSRWLYFYEVWRQTGAWLGKGTHPDWPQHSEKGGANVPDTVD